MSLSPTSLFTGAWLCGKMHGEGELHWPDGRVYRGSFRQNQQYGFGSSESFGPNGTTYEGSWKDGKMNGYGILKYCAICYFYLSLNRGFNFQFKYQVRQRGRLRREFSRRPAARTRYAETGSFSHVCRSCLCWAMGVWPEKRVRCNG